MDTANYPGVSDRSHLIIKKPREGYEYAYWQWRSESDADAPDKNEAVGAVD